MTKGVDERIDKGAFRYYGHVERMENDRIGKRVYIASVFPARKREAVTQGEPIQTGG